MVSTLPTNLQHPNVVFILADDLGWGDLSIDGQLNYQTPHLDKLVRQGIRFTNSYAVSPVCTPTRVGFFTEKRRDAPSLIRVGRKAARRNRWRGKGSRSDLQCPMPYELWTESPPSFKAGRFNGRYPGRLPIGIQEPLVGSKQAGHRIGLPPEHPTIASLLKANGYETALVGKWHCGYQPNYGRLKSGFDEFFGNLSGAIDYFRHIEPGLVDTEINNHITDPVAKQRSEERRKTVTPLQSEDVAAAILYSVTQPQHVNVNEILIRPTEQEW